MPVGPSQHVSAVADLLVRIDPRKTLDIGMGFGTYGMLVREYLDLWDNVDETKPYAWKRTLDGIEICEKYLTPMHRFLYDTIYIGDARAVVPTLEKHYDLAILADVIEHLTRPEGRELVSALLAISDNVIITTPKKAKAQGALYHNEHERHISQWNEKDFQSFGNCIFVSTEGSIVCCIGAAVPRLKRELHTFKKRMHALFPLAGILYGKMKQALRALTS